MATEKNNFSRFLQTMIDAKSHGEGVSWFASQLSQVRNNMVKVANIYKWLSGATAREVPSKYLEPISNDENQYDPISIALNLTETERIEMFEAYYTSYEYSSKSKNSLFMLFNSDAIESVTTDTKFFRFFNGELSNIDNFKLVVNAFLEYIKCEPLIRENNNQAISDSSEWNNVSIIATEGGLLNEKIIDNLISLITCLIKSNMTVDLTLIFANKCEPSITNKIISLQKLMPLYYLSNVSDCFSTKLTIKTSLTPINGDYIILNSNENTNFGFQLFDNLNKYLYWEPYGVGSTLANQVVVSYALSPRPFAIYNNDDDLVHITDCIINSEVSKTELGKDLAAISKRIHYLDSSQGYAENIGSTLTTYYNVHDFLGDRWVKYLMLYKSDHDESEIIVIPYFINNLMHLMNIDYKLNLKKSIKIIDKDLIELVQKYLSFLSKIAAKPQRS